MKTTKSYSKELKIISPKVRVLGEYINAHTPIKHKCKCGEDWNIAPTSALRGTCCRKCANSNLSRAKTKTTNEYSKDLYRVHKNKISVIGVYKNSGVKLRHRCNTCSNTWYPVPDNVLQGSGCPKCMTVRLSKINTRTRKSYVEQLKISSGGTLTLIGKYKGVDTKTTHKCSICKSNWSSCPSNAILKTKGCGCGLSFNAYKPYNLGNRKVIVRGYEPQALDILIRSYRYNPDSILVDSEGKVPVIKMSKYNNRKRHHPDFYIPKKNLLIEVKSTATLGITKSVISGKCPSSLFYATVKKHNAAKDAGYKYKLMIVNGNKEVQIKPRWYNQSFRSFKAYVLSRL